MGGGAAVNPTDGAADVKRGVVRWVVKIVVVTAIFGAVLFLSSAQLGWGMAWVYLGIYVAQQVILMFVLPPELLAERSSTKQDTKRWDRLLSVLGALWLPLAIYLVAGLDRRNGWTDVSFPVQGGTLVLMVLGTFVASWAMAANKFFSGTVRIQEDRGHQVATGGPYRYVRHPGYLGGILHHLMVPLVLGSLWALVPGVLGAAVLAVRTALEDMTLQEELPGYADYAQQVRYRLLPGVW
jgi:protein-S-isoprenylcysteine O-methyltransferase Ste14